LVSHSVLFLYSNALTRSCDAQAADITAQLVEFSDSYHDA
jgi:peroxiredoxin